MTAIHVTVAAVCQYQDKFLMVEEKNGADERVYNQPAGHVEPGESVTDAVIREMHEETGLSFRPTHLLGCYFLSPADNGKHYLRFAFTGELGSYQPQPLDSDIIAAHWMTLAEIKALGRQLRSGLILKCLEDYLSGTRHSLDSLQHSKDESRLRQLCYNRLPDSVPLK